MEGKKSYVMFVTTVLMSTIPLVNLTLTDTTHELNYTTPTLSQLMRNETTITEEMKESSTPMTTKEIKSSSNIVHFPTTVALSTEMDSSSSSSSLEDHSTAALTSETDFMTALESATHRYEVFYSKNDSSNTTPNFQTENIPTIKRETDDVEIKERPTMAEKVAETATPSSSSLLQDPEATTLNDSTRLPKKVKHERYLEERVRPARPDPGYAGNSEFIRPYRPDSNQYPYFRPTPDYRAPIIRQDATSEASTSEQDRLVTTAPQYRPSANRPYIPQGGFGRPYRPDYQRPPASFIPEKSSTHHDLTDHSRADYDFPRQSETLPSYSKPPMGVNLRPNSDTNIYGPGYNSLVDSSSEDPSGYSSYAEIYPGIETGSKPFSTGTVTSAKNLTRVEFIKADCFENHMKVSMRFNGTFDGLVYSSGYAQDIACSYVNGSGRNHYEFFIRLNRCGTLGQQQVDQDMSNKRKRAQYLVNTVTVQYNPIIEEDIDEHFRVTCEYGSDFWKTVTFPVINVESAAVKLRTGTPVVFTLPPPQCNMEVRSGYGPSGSRITGPVSIGDPITLFIHMKSESAGFDILVSNCFAHNGGQKRLQLIDSHGCVLQEKLITPFRGDQSQQTSLYAYLKAFRFTGSPALYLECDVHMCHGSCPPQRCYWRNKRDASEQNETESVISESVSLFQALEVRHEDVPHAQRNMDKENLVCLRPAGFVAIFALMLLLLLSTIVVACICRRRTKDTDSFLQFPLKSAT